MIYVQRTRCDREGNAIGDPVTLKGVLTSERAFECRMAALYRKYTRERWTCTRDDDGLTCTRQTTVLRFDRVAVASRRSV